MRTITEFFGMSLKSAAEKIPAMTEEATKAAQEAMKTEGKTDEEIAAGLPAAADVLRVMERRAAGARKAAPRDVHPVRMRAPRVSCRSRVKADVVRRALLAHRLSRIRAQIASASREVLLPVKPRKSRRRRNP